MTGYDHLGVGSGDEGSKEGNEGGWAIVHLFRATKLPLRHEKLVRAQIEGYINACLSLPEMTGE